MAFDEHRVSQNFKFGVLYQREGQVCRDKKYALFTGSDDMFTSFLMPALLV